MKYAISLMAAIPVRALPSETSEMVSQILFGEHFIIEEENGNWIKIHNVSDSYEGWIDYKTATVISEEEFNHINENIPSFVKTPFTQIYKEGKADPIRVSIGSIIPFYNDMTQSFRINDTAYFIKRNNLKTAPESHLKQLLRNAELYLNTPYLWGGKTILGIDCSGFVQSVFRINNIKLPRDASQQYKEGEEIKFEDAYPGDLAFFKNEAGKVIHVGIFIEKNKIIHCSGDVHIDTLDERGIFSERLNKYTHFNPEIKRLQIKRRKNKE